MFLMAGAMKATQPRGKLLKQGPWTENFSTGRVRFVGVVELLAAIGLILPAASGIAVLLTPLAVGGLVVMMLLVVLTHIPVVSPPPWRSPRCCCSPPPSWPEAGSARARSEPAQPPTHPLLTTTTAKEEIPCVLSQ
jgi:hypothetical protein